MDSTGPAGQFNRAAWRGMERAAADLDVAVRWAETSGPDDQDAEIGALVDDGCGLVITVGFELAVATSEAARHHPDVAFVILDYPVGPFEPWGDPPPDNVAGVTFRVVDGAFLAGYLAAGVTETGVVGTYGSLPIAASTDFMEGFRLGAGHHDSVHGTVTRVLGWDGTSGDFIRTFDDMAADRAATADLIARGADVILPAALPVSRGACEAASEANAGGAEVRLVLTHTDLAARMPVCSPVALASVVKDFEQMVVDAVAEFLRSGGVVASSEGNLANRGVVLGPFPPAPDVPAELAAELSELAVAVAGGDLVPGEG
ncbi:MAG: BMP family ABC transporter substrate-binding protein [Acidimicrobiia bacterium]|nr:MAG: BMP family ABC transporter substrate-binding protein [Acidimicrobiia bacterium]